MASLPRENLVATCQLAEEMRDPGQTGTAHDHEKPLGSEPALHDAVAPERLGKRQGPGRRGSYRLAIDLAGDRGTGRLNGPGSRPRGGSPVSSEAEGGELPVAVGCLPEARQHASHAERDVAGPFSRPHYVAAAVDLPVRTGERADDLLIGVARRKAEHQAA